MSDGAAGFQPAAPAAKKSKLRQRKGRIGLLFVLPWIIGFLAWYLVPMVFSLWLSFQPADLRFLAGDDSRVQQIQQEQQAAEEIEEVPLEGVAPEEEIPTTTVPDEVTAEAPTLNKREFRWYTHWQKILTDPNIRRSVVVTLKFSVLALPIGILFPLFLAFLMSVKSLRAKSFFRTMFYMPSVIPFVAAVIMFGGIFNSSTGWLNRALSTIGITGPAWTNDPRWIYPFLVAIGLWGVGNAMIIYIAAMNSVSQDLYDAARVDGATGFRIFRHVTLPIISPVTFYLLTLSMIGLFQYFLVPFVIHGTTGNPAGSTLFYGIYFYRVFTAHNFGFAAAMAWGMFVAGLVATALLFWSARYWVHYEFEER